MPVDAAHGWDTARTEAIEAGCRDITDFHRPDLRHDDHIRRCIVGAVLDAIPASVLARLAVERGGFEQVGWLSPGMADGPNIGGLIDGRLDDDDKPVYRLTEGSTDG